MRWLVASVVIVPLASAGAQPRSERLAAPALPDFIVGHTAANDRGTIREEIPRGETVQAWSRMVTTQRFFGLARQVPPAAYARNTLAGLPRACPGATISPVASLSLAGRPAARFQVDCPRSTGGRPETFILLAVSGPSGDMHVKQVAWRGGTTPQHLAWGRGFLAGVTLCTAADRTPQCR